MGLPRISRVRFAEAEDSDRRAGLLGWISLQFGALQLDGITLRRTQADRLTLSFPARRDRQGREHPYVRPLDDEARRHIESQVFRALGVGEVSR